MENDPVISMYIAQAADKNLTFIHDRNSQQTRNRREHPQLDLQKPVAGITPHSRRQNAFSLGYQGTEIGRGINYKAAARGNFWIDGSALDHDFVSRHTYLHLSKLEELYTTKDAFHCT